MGFVIHFFVIFCYATKYFNTWYITFLKNENKGFFSRYLVGFILKRNKNFK